MLKSALSAACSTAFVAGALFFTPAYSADDSADAKAKAESAKMGCTESDMALMKSKADAVTDEDTKSKVRSDVMEGKEKLAAGDKAGCAAEVKSSSETMTKAEEKK